VILRLCEELLQHVRAASVGARRVRVSRAQRRTDKESRQRACVCGQDKNLVCASGVCVCCGRMLKRVTVVVPAEKEQHWAGKGRQRACSRQELLL
jgi:hypothetical protein